MFSPEQLLDCGSSGVMEGGRGPKEAFFRRAPSDRVDEIGSAVSKPAEGSKSTTGEESQERYDAEASGGEEEEATAGSREKAVDPADQSDEEEIGDPENGEGSDYAAPLTLGQAIHAKIRRSQLQLTKLALEQDFELDGATRRAFVSAQPPEEYPWQVAVEDLRKLAEGYGWPEFGHDAEMESLSWHARQADDLRKDAPHVAVSEQIISKTVELLPKINLPEDFMQRTHYERTLQRLNYKASPGYPLMFDYPDNRTLFKRDVKGNLDPSRVEMVWQMVRKQLSERSADPIRLFVKPEPHTRRKIDQKRWRLISSVSLIDQIIDQMLFGEMNDSWVSSWFTSPLKVGWVPYMGGWKLFPKGKNLAIDKSSWDWTVQLWLIELELNIRAQLVRYGPHRDYWVELATWRYRKLYVENRFVTSGGIILKQLKPGIQKSGCVNTLMTNSLMQYILHLRVCLETGQHPGWFWCLGDDTLQEIPTHPKEYLDTLRGYCVVKQASLASEFAGFKFVESRVEPLYRAKHAFNMLHMDVLNQDEFRRAYQLLYYKSSHKQRIQELMGEAPSSFRALWDGW